MLRAKKGAMLNLFGICSINSIDNKTGLHFHIP
jgi:hypothetical protein